MNWGTAFRVLQMSMYNRLLFIFITKIWQKQILIVGFLSPLQLTCTHVTLLGGTMSKFMLGFELLVSSAQKYWNSLQSMLDRSTLEATFWICVVMPATAEIEPWLLVRGMLFLKPRRVPEPSGWLLTNVLMDLWSSGRKRASCIATSEGEVKYWGHLHKKGSNDSSQLNYSYPLTQVLELFRFVRN